MPASLLQRNLLGSKIQSVQKIDGHYDSHSLTPNLRQVDVVGALPQRQGIIFTQQEIFLNHTGIELLLFVSQR